jgi:hypothetical protein
VQISVGPVRILLQVLAIVAFPTIDGTMAN